MMFWFRPQSRLPAVAAITWLCNRVILAVCALFIHFYRRNGTMKVVVEQHEQDGPTCRDAASACGWIGKYTDYSGIEVRSSYG